MKNISNYLSKEIFFFQKQGELWNKKKKETLNFKTQIPLESRTTIIEKNKQTNKLVNQKLGYKNLPRMGQKIKMRKNFKRG